VQQDAMPPFFNQNTRCISNNSKHMLANALRALRDFPGDMRRMATHMKFMRRTPYI